MTVLVFGASGMIGRYLLPALVADGCGVLAISRGAHADGERVRWLSGCLPRAVPDLPEGEALEAVVCLGPLDHFSAWLEGAAIAGAPRIVAMSSMSAQSKRASPLAAERELAARLRAAEQRLSDHCAGRGWALTVLRATLIYGGPGGSLEALAAQARRRYWFPLLCGRGLRQPVHAADLAGAVHAALARPTGAGVLACGGGERLPAWRMFARAWWQLAPLSLPLPLPMALMRLAARRLHRGQGMVQRADQDLVADNEKLLRSLAVRPRAFVPRLHNRAGEAGWPDA